MIDPLYSLSGLVVGLLVGMTGIGVVALVLAIALFVVASRIAYDHGATASSMFTAFTGRTAP